MSRLCSRGVVLLAVLQACGCSLTANKTPTPAAALDTDMLARLPHPPGERFYLLMFGSHDLLHRPKYTHTWASLVRAIDPPGGGEPALEVHTISWLPVTLDIRPQSRRVEPGKNFELHETVRNCLDTKQKIAVWGPYEVSYPFVVRFLTQKAFLDSGAVGYQCNDVIGEAARTGDGCDCIHAVSDMDPAYPRWRYPLAFYGQPGTADLVRRFMHSPIFIDPRATHDWVFCRLGLGEYPMWRRTYIGRVDPYRDGGAGDFDRSLAIPVAPRSTTLEPAPGGPPSPQ